MKSQLLIAQLTMLLEQPAAQRRFRRQSSPPGLLHTAPTQVLGDQPDQCRMLVQPLRHRLQFTPDLMPGEKIEYARLDMRSSRIVGPGGDAFVFGISGLSLKAYAKPPGFAPAQSTIPTIISGS